MKIWISALIPESGAEIYEGVRIAIAASEEECYRDLGEWLIEAHGSDDEILLQSGGGGHELAGTHCDECGEEIKRADDIAENVTAQKHYHAECFSDWSTLDWEKASVQEIEDALDEASEQDGPIRLWKIETREVEP